jgi:hypothetical protein
MAVPEYAITHKMVHLYEERYFCPVEDIKCDIPTSRGKNRLPDDLYLMMFDGHFGNIP